MTPPRCPYCGALALLAQGREVRPDRADLAWRHYWLCRPCDAWTGADAARDFAPTARMADPALRAAHQEAHAAFDRLWRGGEMSQSGAYRWLATSLGMPKAMLRIAQFDAALCRKVVAAVAGRVPKAP